MQDTGAIIEYLDQKFSALDAYLDRRFDEALSTSLATCAASAEMGEIKEELRNVNTRIDDIYRHLDKQAQRESMFEQELVMMGSQVSRHERWHRATAKKIGMKLLS